MPCGAQTVQNGSVFSVTVYDCVGLSAGFLPLPGALMGPHLPGPIVTIAEWDDVHPGPIKKTPCPPVPAHPDSADINQNIQTAETVAQQMWNQFRQEAPSQQGSYLTFEANLATWLYSQVRNKGPWDYKQDKSGSYENFGNFNFGAIGLALGLDQDTLLRAAGAAQIAAGTSQPGWGYPWTVAPYGDDPADQRQIKFGFQYFQALTDGTCK